MSTQAINLNLLARLKDKKYRDLFVASQINRIIPFQIRALRAARDNMTQEELAERAETTQSVISRIQNQGAANLNIKSLLKLASAFDVALVVRFEPIDRFIDWVDDLSPEVMSPESSEAVLAKAEHEADKPEAGVPKATPASQLRLASSTIGTYQPAFRFEAALTGLAGQTPARQSARTNVPQTSDARVRQVSGKGA